MATYPSWLCSSLPQKKYEEKYKSYEIDQMENIFTTFQSVLNVPDINGETVLFHVNKENVSFFNVQVFEKRPIVYSTDNKCISEAGR